MQHYYINTTNQNNVCSFEGSSKPVHLIVYLAKMHLSKR